MQVDQNIVDAFGTFFMYGFYPGSCAAYLLLGDYDTAIKHAHHMIRPHDIWQNHIQLVEHYIPLCCKGANFTTWKGYECEIFTDPELELVLKLTKNTLVNSWINIYGSVRETVDHT